MEKNVVRKFDFELTDFLVKRNFKNDLEKLSFKTTFVQTYN